MQVADLRPNPKNPRTITDQKLEMLKKALLEFGDLGGFVYNSTTGRLVGGHQRAKIFDQASTVVITKDYKAPTRTGTTHEGYVLFQGERFKYRQVKWAPEREKAANIAANKGAGEWDLPLLSEWLKDLSSFDLNFDLDLTMFDESERDALFPKIENKPGEIPDDEIPEKVPARVKAGEVYQLGRHRLMCGDSLDYNHYLKLSGGKQVDLAFVDPPYGVNERTERKKAKRGGFAHSNDFAPVIGDDSIETAVNAYTRCLGFARDLIFFGANYYAKALPETSSWIVWDKRDDKGRDDNADCELAWSNRGGPARVFRHLWKGAIKASEHGERRVHPTQKPVALAEWAITEYPKEKVETVFDPFGGSGSTLIACEKTGRTCFMMELDPNYCDTIIARWEKFTGKTARFVKEKNK